VLPVNIPSWIKTRQGSIITKGSKRLSVSGRELKLTARSLAGTTNDSDDGSRCGTARRVRVFKSRSEYQ